MNIEEYRMLESERIQANRRRMEEDGVDFIDIYSAYIDDTVVIERGVLIANNVTLKGNTIIHKDAYIGQSSVLRNAEIGEGSTVEASYIYDSKVGDHSRVGPFAYIRPGSTVGERCKVGNFVEVKNAAIGDGSRSSHLAYIGDADIGQNVHVGSGVMFANYDGSKKHRSTVGDDAFIGCNSSIVSPVEIGEGAYVAAGTTVTEDVPGDALAIGRVRASNKEEWVKSRKILKKDQ